MNNVSAIKAYFSRELDRLDSSIARLESRFKEENCELASTASCARLYEMLTIEKHNRQLLLELASMNGQPCDLLQEIRLRISSAEQTHYRISQNGHSRNLMYYDDWWDSLGEAQFLSKVYTGLQQAINRHLS